MIIIYLLLKNMFGFLFNPYFYVPYILLNLVLALYMKSFGKKFYDYVPINKDPTDTDDITSSNNAHNQYPEFRRYDNFSFWRLFLGLIFLFWIRMIVILILAFGLWLTLKISFRKEESNSQGDNTISPEKRRFIIKAVRFFSTIGLFVYGIIRREERNSFEPIYKKYLGDDYKIQFDDNYSVIISNHISWVEIVYLMNKYVPGFISKDTVKSINLVGYIAEKIDCIFLDRTSQENRTKVVIKTLCYLYNLLG
jgi:hypothetical protein